MANPYVAAIGAVIDIGTRVAVKMEQDRSRKAHEAQTSPLAGGRSISVSFSAAGQQKVQHLFGRAPSGWVVAGKNAAADIWSYAAADGSFLYLESDAAVSLTLLVF
jgi:hypothetical protein